MTFYDMQESPCLVARVGDKYEQVEIVVVGSYPRNYMGIHKCENVFSHDAIKIQCNLDGRMDTL